MSEKHSGRPTPSMHEHYKDIETPFIHNKSEDSPHHGSHPDHYSPHQEHTRKNLHGK